MFKRSTVLKLGASRLNWVLKDASVSRVWARVAASSWPANFAAYAPVAGRPKRPRNAWFTCVVVSAILAPSIEKFEKSNFQYKILF